MASTASATQHEQPLDLGALEADARARLAELHEARQRLSLPAVSDPSSEEATELRRIEDEIASAEAFLERTELAAAERDRREIEARQQAEERAREQAERKVEKLERDRQAALREADHALAAMALVLAKVKAVCGDLDEALEQSGRGATWTSFPRSPDIQGGLIHALESAGLSYKVLGLDFQRAAPLAEPDTNPSQQKGK